VTKKFKKTPARCLSRGPGTFARTLAIFFSIFMMAGKKQNQEGSHGQWIPDLLSFLLIFFTFVKIIL
jgi:hypothetical protein